MRNIFFLSLAVSPLVLLLPRKLDGDGIRKDILITVSDLESKDVQLTIPISQQAVAWGNVKPPHLQDFESKLWIILVHMAAGKEKKSLFTELAEHARRILATPPTAHQEADWFVSSK